MNVFGELRQVCSPSVVVICFKTYQACLKQNYILKEEEFMQIWSYIHPKAGWALDGVVGLSVLTGAVIQMMFIIQELVLHDILACIMFYFDITDCR